MMKHSVLYWFTALSGIITLTILSIQILSSASGIFGLLFAAFDIMLVCHVLNRMMGIFANESEAARKKSRIFAFLSILGVAFLASFFLVDFGIASGMFKDLEFLWSYPMGYSLWFLLIAGTIFLTVGTSGVGSKHFHMEQGAFAALTTILVPSLIFTLWFLMIMSRLTIGL